MNPINRAAPDVQNMSIDAIINDLLHSKNLYNDIFVKYRPRFRDIIANYPNTLSLGRILITHLEQISPAIITDALNCFFALKPLNSVIFNELANQIVSQLRHERVTSALLKTLADNPSASTATLKQLLDQIEYRKVDDRVLAAIAGNQHTTAEMLHQLLQGKHHQVNLRVFMAIAGNPNSTTAILEQLLARIGTQSAQDNIEFSVTQAIANNPSATIVILSQLIAMIVAAPIDAGRTLEAIANNPHTTTDLLKRLLEIKPAKLDCQIIKAIASNHNATAGMLEQLLAQIQPKNMDDKVLVDQEVITAIAGNPHATVAIFKQIIQHLNHYHVDHLTLQAIANNSHAPTETLQQLLTTKHCKIDSGVHAAIAGNHHATPEMLAQLLAIGRAYDAPNCSAVLTALAANPGTPTEILEQLLATGVNQLDSPVLVAIASNLHTTAAMFGQLFKYKSAKITGAVLTATASNPNIPISLLRWFIKSHATENRISWQVLKNLTTNPHYTDETVLESIKAQILLNPAKLQFFANISSSGQLAAIITQLLQAADQDNANLSQIKQAILANPVAYLLQLGSNYSDPELVHLLSNCYAKNKLLYNHPIQLPDEYAKCLELREQIAILKNSRAYQLAFKKQRLGHLQAEMARLSAILAHGLNTKTQ